MKLATVNTGLVKEGDIVDYTKEYKFTGGARKAKQKSEFLNCIVYNVFNVLAASRKYPITERTHYNWLDSDPEYARAFHDAKRAMKSFCEAIVFKCIAGGDGRLALEWLDRHAQDEGYGKQRQYIPDDVHQISNQVTINIE